MYQSVGITARKVQSYFYPLRLTPSHSIGAYYLLDVQCANDVLLNKHTPANANCLIPDHAELIPIVGAL